MILGLYRIFAAAGLRLEQLPQAMPARPMSSGRAQRWAQSQPARQLRALWPMLDRSARPAPNASERAHVLNKPDRRGAALPGSFSRPSATSSDTRVETAVCAGRVDAARPPPRHKRYTMYHCWRVNGGPVVHYLLTRAIPIAYPQWHNNRRLEAAFAWKPGSSGAQEGSTPRPRVT